MFLLDSPKKPGFCCLLVIFGLAIITNLHILNSVFFVENFGGKTFFCFAIAISSDKTLAFVR